MKVAIIGHGAIASYVRKALDQYGVAEVAEVVRPGKEATGVTPKISDLRDLPAAPNLVVDCGGHSALSTHGPIALGQGIDILTVSLGALADADLYDRLLSQAIAGGSRLHLTSGAIGALDALRAASKSAMEAVTCAGRKPPLGWMGSPAEEKFELYALDKEAQHFSGTARRAALDYPKNANVAAAVALAGIGFDETQVALIADPTIKTNVHEIDAKGDFGEFRFTISGNSLPDNPRSSALTAMSVIAELAERKKRVGF